MAYEVLTSATLGTILKMKAWNHMGHGACMWGKLTISVSLGTYSSVPTHEFFLLTTLLVLTKWSWDQCL